MSTSFSKNSPTIVEYRVVPVAGYDSPLLTLSGMHAPYFTRNIVVLKDSEGRLGLGETHGGEKITASLESYRDYLLGERVLDYKAILNKIQRSKNSSMKTGIQSLDISKLTDVVLNYGAVESALLDLVGQSLDLPVCALLSHGQQRKEVAVLGYLFFVEDGAKTPLPYLREDEAEDPWFRARRHPFRTAEEMIDQVRLLKEKYGFTHFKLKGGVYASSFEMEVLTRLKKAYPESVFSIDPNGAWSLPESLAICSQYKDTVAYFEDPASAEHGYSGREVMAEIRKKTKVLLATNMIATDWQQLYHALVENSLDIVLADPHFWTMQGAVDVSKVLKEFGMLWGSHSNNHFDISLAIFAQTAAAALGQVMPLDTHWIWQDGQALTKNPYQIQNGYIQVGDKPGLGLELEEEKLQEAHALYLTMEERFRKRDDALAMQYLLPGWTFDSKRPVFVR